MNAVTHGLYAESVVLSTESPEEHQEMLDAYIQQLQPDGQAEFDLVEEMVAAKWRHRRLWAIETHLLQLEMLTQKKILDEKYSSHAEITELTFAYSSLATSSALPFLARNESRLERAYARALKNLLELQRTRKSAQRTQSQVQTPRTQPALPQPSPVFPPPTNHHPPAARPTAEQNLQERTQSQIRTERTKEPATQPPQVFPTTYTPQPTTLVLAAQSATLQEGQGVSCRSPGSKIR